MSALLDHDPTDVSTPPRLRLRFTRSGSPLTLGQCRNPRCGRRDNLKWRGLCRGCYDDHSIRDHYTRRYASRPDEAPAKLSDPTQLSLHRPRKDWTAWQPTNEEPGTEARVLVYQLRAALGLPIHHPSDTKAGRYTAAREEFVRRSEAMREAGKAVPRG